MLKNILPSGPLQPYVRHFVIAENKAGMTYNFRRQGWSSGIDKWTVCMEQLTCTYNDKAGQEILAEAIPAL
nr:DUF1398 family protein [Arsenicibacter rosenii]